MKGSKPFPFLALAFYLCVLTACGSSHPANGPSALNIGNSSVPDGVVLSAYSVTLVPIGGLGPFTWTLNSGALPPGLTLSSGGVISGTPPVSDLDSTGAAKKYNFGVKVTDSQTPTAAFQTKGFSITINPLPVVTSTTLPDGTIGLPYTGGTLTNTGGLAPFTWSVVPGSGTLPAGLSVNGSAITGTPTGPAMDYPFTIQVTDADGNTATAPVSITIKGKLQGTFAFSFNGFDNTGTQPQPFYTAGSFVGDGAGNLTGVLDQNSLSTADVASAASFTGTYSISTTNPNLGSMTLTIGAPLNVTYNYTFAIPLAGDLKFILADTNHPQVYGSGVIKAQNITGLTGVTSLSGSWVLGFSGVDPAGKRSAGAGFFKADTSGNLTNGIEDTNDNGIVQSQVLFTGSFAGVDLTTGRGTATLSVGGNTLNYAFYVVNPKTEMIAVQTDPVSGGASLSLVSLLGQLSGSVNGSLGNGSLNASSVMELNGVSNSTGSALPDVQLGVGMFDGMGNITLFQTDENNGGTLTENSLTGTYNVDSTNGRVTVSGLGGGPQPVWYLVNTNRAFVIGTDPSVTAGSLEPQTGSPFSLPNFLLAYAGGTIQPALASVTNEVDTTFIPAPGGTLVVTYDTSGSATGEPMMNLMLSSTYSLGDDPNQTGMNTTGKILLTAVGSAPTNSCMCTAIVYMITGPPAASGMGSIDRTNNKWASINVATPTGAADPNPRLTVVQSITGQ